MSILIKKIIHTLEEKDYTIEIVKGGDGPELFIWGPGNPDRYKDQPIIVALDIYGERNVRPQVLVYTPEEEEIQVAVRLNPKASIQEVAIADGIETVSKKVWTDWLQERDGDI
jgi:hypothetical protein